MLRKTNTGFTFFFFTQIHDLDKPNFISILLVFFLLVIYIYVIAWQNLPSELIVFEGENINIKTIFGMKINSNEKIIQTSSITNEQITRTSRKKDIKS